MRGSSTNSLFAEDENEHLTVQGLPMYTSHTLNIKDKLIQGELYKKSRSGAANFFKVNQYLKRYFHIDFQRHEVTQRADYHPETKIKRTPFKEIKEIAFEELDDVGN